MGGAMDASSPSIIKVIGVGGGGGNAVNHMYREGISGVNFVLCNTDSKALSDSPVPHRLRLGKDGLGAGNDPQRAKLAAEESIEQIHKLLNDGTKMVFITAGMGGGTGTGAAPIIAHEAKEMGILTVGIVTIPFRFEGIRKIDKALDGVEAMHNEVDALLVVNNERLRTVYPELSVLNALEKADNTLTVAARSIADIITMRGVMNLDFQDVCTMMRDSGVAIISTGYAEGEGRVSRAIDEALHSPLLNNNDIYSSKRVLLCISFSKDEEGNNLMMDEMNEVDEFMMKFPADVDTKWGMSVDSALGAKVKVTILATGFGLSSVPGMEDKVLEDSEEKAERREKFYPLNNMGGTHSRRHKIYLFDAIDLDNEEVISSLDVSATVNRTKEELKAIREKNR
ncbi:MAG: cell division protein FtsZ [Bacteroidaceae bacterium]|nr:cell division protein FtsZ [Bacteroidaceae bacterium]